jgi:hypothetical protein
MSNSPFWLKRRIPESMAGEEVVHPEVSFGGWEGE